MQVLSWNQGRRTDTRALTSSVRALLLEGARIRSNQQAMILLFENVLGGVTAEHEFLQDAFIAGNVISRLTLLSLLP